MERRILRAIWGSLAVAVAALVLAGSADARTRLRVLAVHFDTEVNPVTQGYLNHAIGRANDDGYAAVVILLDTPGGLSESMRKIVKKEIASRIPVIVYVSPPGARAASAGVWIGEAADILAMAPQTNIGSSTPISSSGQNIDSDLRRKVINDAAASLRSLMRYHHRNAAFADRAVRKAANLTADEALRQHVIDVVAPSLPALLEQLDGRKTIPRGQVLELAGADVTEVAPSFFTRFLNVLVDPNLISLLFLAGLAGIGYEVFHPGVVLPGALGAVALVMALFGFAVLPVSWAGILLVLLAVVLFVVDAHVVTHGALTVAGLVSLVTGLLLLFHNAPSPYHTSVPLVASVGAALGLSWAFLIAKAVQARRRPVAVGVHELVGATGEVRREGLVFVRGELWQVREVDGEALEPGERVRVEGVEGLRLAVRRVGAAAGVS